MKLGILDKEKSFIENFTSWKIITHHIEGKEIVKKEDINQVDALLICKSQVFGIKEICEWVIQFNKSIPIWIFTSEELLEEKNVYLQLGVCGIFNGGYTSEEISLSISNSLSIIKSPIHSEAYTQKTFQLDPSKLRLTIENEYISLTKLEYFLLEELYERKNEVCTYEELAEALFANKFEAGDLTAQYRVTNIVCKIRAKLATISQGKQKLIKTIRSRGYILSV